jgi:serine/threonine-protein kinase
VAARTSAFTFRDRGADLRGIAEKLGVATVLQGSVRRAGDRIRVSVQLVDVGSGFQIWSDRYDRELKDIFDVQDEIARTVADRLKVTLTLGADQRLVAKVTGNLESYELLLKGRTLLTRRGRAILDAQTCFERAVGLDPGLAEAHALLGDSYRLIGLYGIAPTAEMMPKARAAADRALAIDPHQVEALATLANIAAVYDWDIARSLLLSDRALDADRNHVRALGERAMVPTLLEPAPQDIADTAYAHVRRARQLDPLNAWAASIECFCLHNFHRPGDAVAMAHQAVGLDDNNFTARWVQVWTLSSAGRFEEALAAAEQAMAMSARNPRILTEVAAIHAARGDLAAVRAIDEELHERSRTGFIGRAEQGAVAAAAGRMTDALDLVRQALDARDSYLTFWKLPAWQPFRRNPEGHALLASAAFRRFDRR